MIPLLLLGCAQHIFGSRNIDCEGFTRLRVEAPQSLVVTVYDEGEDAGCDVRANADALREVDGDTLVITRAREVELIGDFELEVTWGDDLFVFGPGVTASSQQAGTLEVDAERGIACGDCQLEVTATEYVLMTLYEQADVRVCSGAPGRADLEGGRLDLSVTPDAGGWVVTGFGELDGHVPYQQFPITVDSAVVASLVPRDEVLFECCSMLDESACLGADADVDIDVDVDADSDADADVEPPEGQSCMTCHNQGLAYQGPGLEDPHPWAFVACTQCHGGDASTDLPAFSHIPRPDSIGPDQARTLAGVDRIDPFDDPVTGSTYDALDWLQFRNPGDLRVTSAGRSCGLGGCHADVAGDVSTSLMATNAGIYSVPEMHTDAPADDLNGIGTLAVWAFRDIAGPALPDLGVVPALLMLDTAFTLPDLSQIELSALVDDANRIVTTPTEAHDLLALVIDGLCGDCHLGSAGPNAGPGGYRSSGCTACHMPAAENGRLLTGDPNLALDEPADPANPSPDERIHVGKHELASTLQGGAPVPDRACGVCHSGSAGTWFEYQGIRVDLASDVESGFGYPVSPVSHELATGLTSLGTYQGYTADQLVRVEDHDGDGRDDTPPDVHFERGLGCIDCHVGDELHGDGVLYSHAEQATIVRCETCHGTVDEPPEITSCIDDLGQSYECVWDPASGVRFEHVRAEPGIGILLTSRMDGLEHYVVRTRDVVDPTSGLHPYTNQPLYNADAQWAMQTVDHTSTMECVACHSSWSNTCVSCHVQVAPFGNARSSVTGAPIPLDLTVEAGYGSALFFTLGVGPRGRIQPFQPGTPTFYEIDDGTDIVARLAFSDRVENGNNPGVGGRGPHAALTHAPASPHTIRGAVDAVNEGPRYCTACHLVNAPDAITSYETRVSAGGATGDYELSLSPNNSVYDPMYVRMVAGLGTGLYALSDTGCPINPLDSSPNRPGCGGISPANGDVSADPVYAIDRLVQESGVSNAASLHPIEGGPSGLRVGARSPGKAGPLGISTIQQLVDPDNGIVLDEWLDADGAYQTPNQ